MTSALHGELHLRITSVCRNLSGASSQSQGITSPFPIQTGTLPDSLAGRDVLGRGKTGSGKTLAFSIPLVARLAARTAPPVHSRPGLVLAPTRELATQITAVIEPLAGRLGMNVDHHLRWRVAEPQVSALRAGVDIVVACPGRLEDLMEQRHMRSTPSRSRCSTRPTTWPTSASCPASPASWPPPGRRSAAAVLRHARQRRGQAGPPLPAQRVLHSVDEVNSPVAAMTHHVFTSRVPPPRSDARRGARLGHRSPHPVHAHQAPRQQARQAAHRAGIPSVDLHGNLSQPARDRNLAAFSVGRGPGARRDRHRRPRRARRRRRTRRPRRPADGAQGVPAPLRPHRPGRQRG